MATTTQTYGIVLPITHGPQGYFNQSISVIEQVKSNLNLLLKTKKGERRMNPDFGSGLWNVLFENMADDMTPIIDSTIRRDIAKWMSYVNVQSVSVLNNKDNNYNRLDVSVVFTVPSIGVFEQQTLQVGMNTNNI
jgi:phage baseplate assembly protein W